MWKELRKIALGLLITMLSSSLILGLWGFAPAPSLAAPTTKPIVLKFHNPWPSTHHLAKNVLDPWGKKLEEASGGRIDYVPYHGGALGKPSGVYDLVRQGGAEAGVWIPYSMPAQFPLNLILHLPFSSPNSKVATEIYNKLYEKFPAFRKEFEDVHPYSLFGTDVYPLWTAKKKIVHPTDMKGLKIRASGIQDRVVKECGGSPVSVTAADVYIGMERGMIDGAIYSWTGAWGLKLPEVSKYVTNLDVGLVAANIIMNKKWYNKLPKDLKKIVDDLGPYITKLGVKSYEEGVEEVVAKLKEMKKPEFISLSPEVMKEWRKVALPMWDEWAEEQEAKGLPGKEVLAEFKRLLREHGVAIPTK